MQRVRIADLTIDIQNADTAFFEHRLQAYRDASSGAPDLCIRFDTPEQIAYPEGPTKEYNERLRVTELADGRRCRGLYGKQSGKLLQTITTTTDYAEADICVLRGRQHPTLTLTDFEYMFTGLVFSDRLTQLGGMVLHGSSVAYEGNGLVFSAPSGTGKSTHAGLWRETYGDRVVTINDDKPAIRFDDSGNPIVYGTPWSGKTELNNNVAVPLSAIVFLERKPQNEIRQLSASEALLYMGRELALPYHDDALCETLWDTATRLVQAVPVFLLGCTVSTEAVELVRKTIGL